MMDKFHEYNINWLHALWMLLEVLCGNLCNTQWEALTTVSFNVVSDVWEFWYSKHTLKHLFPWNKLSTFQSKDLISIQYTVIDSIPVHHWSISTLFSALLKQIRRERKEGRYIFSFKTCALSKLFVGKYRITLMQLTYSTFAQATRKIVCWKFVSDLYFEFIFSLKCLPLIDKRDIYHLAKLANLGFANLAVSAFEQFLQKWSRLIHDFM